MCVKRHCRQPQARRMMLIQPKLHTNILYCINSVVETCHGQMCQREPDLYGQCLSAQIEQWEMLIIEVSLFKNALLLYQLTLDIRNQIKNKTTFIITTKFYIIPNIWITALDKIYVEQRYCIINKKTLDSLNNRLEFREIMFITWCLPSVYLES